MRPMKHEPIVLQGSSELYVTPRSVADTLGVTVDAIYAWVKRYPSFPALRLPGHIRVRASEVENWLLHELPKLKQES